MSVGLQNEILDEVSRRFLFKLRLGASGGYPVGLSVGVSSIRNCVGGCVGGLSQIFKAGCVGGLSQVSRLLIGPIQISRITKKMFHATSARWLCLFS